MTFSVFPRDHKEETTWRAIKGSTTDTVHECSLTNLLLKRLTVYLSAILKTLFENKVFDTIISLLYRCFCKLFTDLWTHPGHSQTVLGSNLTLSSRVCPCRVCMFPWVSSSCSRSPELSDDIVVRWVFSSFGLRLLALKQTADMSKVGTGYSLNGWINRQVTIWTFTFEFTQSSVQVGHFKQGHWL